jgi:transcriptional regulator with XRE-family HTH domain
MQRRARHIQPTDLKRKAIGAAVAELRRAAGFSQERLSADCGFERTYLSRVERGILNPTAIRVWTIAEALKCRFANWLVALRRGRWSRLVGESVRPPKASHHLTLGIEAMLRTSLPD